MATGFVSLARVNSRDLNEETMKKNNKTDMQDDLRPEYDLRELLKTGVKGKYADRYRAGTNLVLLAPDVAEAFPNEETVNETLRLVMKLRKIQVGKKRKVSKV